MPGLSCTWPWTSAHPLRCEVRCLCEGFYHHLHCFHSRCASTIIFHIRFAHIFLPHHHRPRRLHSQCASITVPHRYEVCAGTYSCTIRHRIFFWASSPRSRSSLSATNAAAVPPGATPRKCPRPGVYKLQTSWILKHHSHGTLLMTEGRTRAPVKGKGLGCGAVAGCGDTSILREPLKAR